MNRWGRGQGGFTLIEVIVVIAVIAILAAISTIGFARYQTYTNDSERQAKAGAIIETLEQYYDSHGEYPGCTTLTAAADTVTGPDGALAGLEIDALITPLAADATTNSISCSDLTSTAGPDVYAYVGDGSTTCSSGTSCLSYTIKYKNETSNTIVAIQSRRSSAIASSGQINNLSITASTCSTASLAWSSVPNALGYNLQAATNSGFTNNLKNEEQTVLTHTFTSLEQGALYYYRARPMFENGQQGAWSNVPSATTQNVTAPVLTIGTVGANSIAYSWGAVSGADGYNYEVASESTFANIVDSGTTTATSNTTSGLTPGLQYWVRVNATAPNCSPSAWDAESTVTTVSTPTGLSLAVNSNTQITASWNAVAGATSYTVQYTTNSSFASYNTATSTTASRAIGGLQQGTTWYFRVIANAGSATSNASSVAAATTGIDGASSLWAAAYRPNAVRAYASGYWVAWISSPASGNWYYAYADGGASCPSGAYPVYQFASRYNSPSTTYYTGATTATTWYMVQPTSGYSIKFSVRAYCQGPNTNSGWSGWVESCARNPGSTVACTF